MDPIEPLAGDPRFFPHSGAQTIAALAAAIGAEASFDDGRLIAGIAPLQRAAAGQLSVLDNRKYAHLLAETGAGAVVVHADLVAKVPEGAVALVMKDPYRGWALAAALLHPFAASTPGVHPTAIVPDDAQLDASVEIGAYAVIGAGARIGAGTAIGPHVVIGDGVVLGSQCRVGAHASVSHTIAGDRIYIYPGARVGQEGFGFVSTSVPFLTVPQLGRVILEDDVEVGANCTIDRGSVQDTVIGAGSRIDNLVQIAHNVRLGRCCVIAAQVGLAGSTVLEDFVQAGGQAGVAGHLHIGKGVRIAAQSGLMNDVPAGQEVFGSPAEPVREYWRRLAILRRIARGYKAAGQSSDSKD